VGRGSWRGGEENQNPTKHVALGPWAPPHPVRAPPPGIARPFAAHAQYRGPVQEHIEARVREALKPLHLEVANESHGRAQETSRTSTCWSSRRPSKAFALCSDTAW
ncbi:unnamed protein product, partial [Prorocentrum cordatum]